MEDPLIFKILSTITLVASIAFIIAFARDRGGWWRKSELGRSLMVMTIGVGLFALTSFLRQWLGDSYIGRQELRIFAQLLIAFGVTSRLWVLLKAQWTERHR